MCGIYGVALSSTKSLAESDAGQIILAGLKRLEYRGYDSWGISVVDATTQELRIDKHVGKIGGVEQIALPAAQIALGHTRWATHGGVTDINAHPHLASDGSFALVQNGVMENFQEMKADLIAAGYSFISQTDTEVIVHLLEKNRSGAEVTFADFAKTFLQLTGRNTVGVLTKTGALFAIRNGSPLVIARDAYNNWFLSSDVVSVAADAVEFYPLESNEGVEVVGGQARVFTISGSTPVEKKLVLQPIEVSALRLDKAGFSHFMLKEVFEQPEVLHTSLQQEGALFAELAEKVRGARRVYTVGAGSADFVSGQIAFLLRQAGVAATPVKAYEASSYTGLFGKDDVCIAISQSGETADTIEVVEWMKAKGMTIASIVNMPGSSLTRLSDFPCMLQIGPEIGICSTKAVTSMMTWGMALVWQVSGKKLADFSRLLQEYETDLAAWLKNDELDNTLRVLAKDFAKTQHLFVLGRGELYMPALESALKLKEISYVHAEGFSGGELKHGVIALIEKGTPVFCLVADDAEQANMLSAAAEVSARGARAIGISAKENALFAEWIQVPSNKEFVAISSIIPAQLLTYYMALEKGLDPDKPRNLAKSVTVK